MNQRIQTWLLICLLIAWSAILSIGQTESRSKAIQHWAEVYRSNPNEAEQNYSALVGSDRANALRAADQLGKQKHYELAALALADVKDRNVKGNLIKYVLAQKAHFSPTTFSATINELEEENNLATSDDGEEAAGRENNKAALATAISKWLKMPDPKLDQIPSDSRTGYATFIREARQKATTMTENLPD